MTFSAICFRPGRTSADQAHEFRYTDPETNEVHIAARVLVTIVKVDQKTNKPSPIVKKGELPPFEVQLTEVFGVRFIWYGTRLPTHLS